MNKISPASLAIGALVQQILSEKLSPPASAIPHSGLLNKFELRDHPMEDSFHSALASKQINAIIVHCSPELKEVAERYIDSAGVGAKSAIALTEGSATLDAIRRPFGPGILPLIVDSATSPTLKDRFFSSPEITYFADHHYAPRGGSRELFTIGTSAFGIDLICQADPETAAAASGKRRESEESIFANEVNCFQFRDFLRSSQVQKIELHALGPKGTNIAQASELYLRSIGVEHKGEVVVHPSGIEPMDYAQIARNRLVDGTLPLHMECAVYYRMGDLYRARQPEMVFADHYYMRLDAMQLAGPESFDTGRTLKIASHPSPAGLIDAWTQRGIAKYVKATSNAAAAEMVRAGEADLCITTESGRERYGLTTHHVFGAPNMIFTIGAPLSERTLREAIG
ncbi:MAG: hypothetical protein J5J00_08070 [Deltaproteobacteria bacterium]|nr:hypothetical protein [Deltaproteobacteria bacterium]